MTQDSSCSSRSERGTPKASARASRLSSTRVDSSLANMASALGPPDQPVKISESPSGHQVMNEAFGTCRNPRSVIPSPVQKGTRNQRATLTTAPMTRRWAAARFSGSSGTNSTPPSSGFVCKILSGNVIMTRSPWYSVDRSPFSIVPARTSPCRQLIRFTGVFKRRAMAPVLGNSASTIRS